MRDEERWRWKGWEMVGKRKREDARWEMMRTRDSEREKVFYPVECMWKERELRKEMREKNI